MKRVILFALTAAMVLALTSCAPKEPPPSESEPEPSQSEPLDPATPAGAVAELFESAKSWDLETVQAHLPEDVVMAQEIPAVFQQPLERVLTRMQYRIGEVDSDGEAATVMLEITSIDVESAANDAVGAAAAYVAKEKLSGRDVTDYNALLDTALGAVNIETLPTKSFEATAYLYKGADGEWKVDFNNQRNLPLLNAVSGGSLDFAAKLQELMGSLGLDLYQMQ